MPNEQAREIIQAAMEDRTVYDAMLTKEQEVWSKVLTNPQRTEVQMREVEAAKELQFYRHSINLKDALLAQGVTPERGLSLGCGAGRAERAFLEEGVCRLFHGVDIAQGAIAEASRIASENGLSLTYEVQDLNFPDFPADTYDLVVAQTCVHHVVHLERLADEIFKTLKPGGVLWLDDYIGETQFQFSDERLQIMNDLIAILPENLRYSHMVGRVVGQIARKTPGTLISPFESIRSAEIPTIFLRRFEVLSKAENFSFIHRVAPQGTWVNFLENNDTRALFAVLLYFDRLLVQKGILDPVVGQYLLRKPAAS